MSKKRFQQIVTLVPVVALFGTACGSIGTTNGALKQPKENATTAVASRESQLQAQEKGYKLVLQREPENQVALEALVNARLQLKDVLGAIAPLEEMVQLYLNRQDYKVVLAQVK